MPLESKPNARKKHTTVKRESVTFADISNIMQLKPKPKELESPSRESPTKGKKLETLYSIFI